MRTNRSPPCLALAVACVVAAGCDKAPPPAPGFDQLSRDDFNRAAMRLNLPVFWIDDANGNRAIDPAETATLLFYPTSPSWTDAGAFTPAFASAYDQMVADNHSGPLADARRALVRQELDRCRPTLLLTDLASAPPEDRAFLEAMVEVAHAIDALYSRQLGLARIEARVPADDPSSRSLFRRNWGPECVDPVTSAADVLCSAIPGWAMRRLELYPEAMQDRPGLCARLESRPDASTLMSPFTVIREKGDALAAIPYHEAWPEECAATARALRAAAATLPASEAPQRAYLEAAARGFETDDWWPADEAWTALGPESSRWFVRVAPDETYWEPCNVKAGYELELGRIDPSSLEWRGKLSPLIADMEDAIASITGPPYAARDVHFRVPDFVEMLLNAGRAREPLGGTIGQSLPNFGPVAEQSRGRSMIVSNFGADPDSVAARRALAASLIDEESLASLSDDPADTRANTIFHEVTHDLGPGDRGSADGPLAARALGGVNAAVIEELKAEAGARWLSGWLAERGVITREQVARQRLDGLVWCFGQIAHGTTSASGEPLVYGRVAAIQIGILVEQGALEWLPEARAANGVDQGAFRVNLEKFDAAAAALLGEVCGIAARGDRAKADELMARHVTSPPAYHEIISRRGQRQPAPSLVYAIRR